MFLGQRIGFLKNRPFFSPKIPINVPQESTEPFPDSYLDASNWTLDLSPQNSWLQGATPGHGQELRHALHPHLDLPNTMVHMPRVRPGDYVSWHCDSIHAVDSVHAGKTDSSVGNAEYLARQRAAFLEGTPSPDFGGGVGESKHINRPGVEDVEKVDAEDGMRAFGLKKWESSAVGLSAGQKQVMERANEILGFA